MNSLVKVFSNFKEFYSEINGATLTGAIDVIVVEQPDGEFQCSPFHVRFGKLGVLRSREKVVDIEINGEPVDIHMKLGESGEAFFVEECQEEEVEELPDNLATSPIPTNYFPSKYTEAKSLKDQEIIDNKVKIASDDLPLPLPLPRRNSIDLSKETTKDDNEQKFENQLSDYSHRRYTDNTLERRNLSEKIKEYTTQKIRQEWAEHEEVFQFDAVEKDKDWSNSTQTESSTQTKAEIITKQPKATILNDKLELPTTTATTVASPIPTITATPFVTPLLSTPTSTLKAAAPAAVAAADANAALHHIKASKSCPDNSIINNEDDEIKMENETLQMTMTQSSASLRGVTGAADDTKGSKKKRRKKSQMKKKNSQRKSSSSSSLGSSNTPIGDNTSVNGLVINSNNAVANINSQVVDEGDGLSISISNNSSNDEEIATASKSTATTKADVQQQQMSPVTPTRIPDLDIHFFSDTECTTSSGNVVAPRGACRPSTPIQSDSELEISLREKGRADDDDAMTNSASWKWGELPTPEAIGQHKDGSMAASQAQRNSMLSGMFNFMKRTNKIRKHVNENGGVYLSDLEAEGMDSEMAALYFPDAGLKKNELLAVGGGSMNAAAAMVAEAASTTTTAMQTEMPKDIEDDRESGNGTSLPHSPSSMEGQKSIDSDYEDGVGGRPQEEGKYLDFVAMSLCGANNEKGLPTDEEFDRHLIKYADVCENPSLFASPNLYVRLNGKYYSWAAACPIVMTIITFQKPLSNNAIEQLMHASGHKDTQTNMNNDMKHEVDNAIQTKRSWWNWRRSPNDAQPPNLKTADKNEKLGDEKDFDQTAVATTQTTRPNSPDVSENTLSKTDSTLNAENTSAMVDNLEDLSQASTRSYEEKGKSGKNERFKKSLRLSSEAIKKLNLKEGANEIEFSVTTAYQGTSRCKCYLFRWNHSDKVVISDIDGTITKSDVLGHLLPMVGKDWAQLGVAQLFSKIEQNGYKLLYLSARAIGQSRATREYLRSIRQGDLQLPDGPLLLNPTSLISAFHREVIERKPEQFKIACLSDIRDLFPNKDPFYAGYGNRINDVWAYRAVGIPIMRIFTINTKGELKHELTQTFQSSYCSMAYIADQLFPPIKADEGSIEFSSFNYWRDPIPEIEVDISFGANGGTNNAANITSTNANNGGGGAGGTLNNSTTAESSVPNAMPEN